MPAIITHDLFGRRVYDQLAEAIGYSLDEHAAFLLGNQGPDPLFYAGTGLGTMAFVRLGATVHEEKPVEILVALHDAVQRVEEDHRSIAKAFSAGFLCHYLLDNAVDPLVFAQERAICAAGVEGLDETARKEVHAFIETSIDEMMLFTQTHHTVKDFAPYMEILNISDEALTTVSQAFSQAVNSAHHAMAPSLLYFLCTRQYRSTQALLHSPRGIKRSIFARIEQAVRPHSFLSALTPRAIESETCDFDNHQHESWTNPFTDEESTASFNDLYNSAFARACQLIPSYLDEENFSSADAQAITRGLNFHGEPTEARILLIEDVPTE